MISCCFNHTHLFIGAASDKKSHKNLPKVEYEIIFKTFNE